ncbi:Hypothetical predicted protein [Paramuricea clavata]|uniref:Uncharacterized protein n=1 Tax=Paramuricea clavata TaxID=317549 RepID=A0A6S7JPH8_PARCT|nr:Hypothetical predicted protein [Paramuricea clavata]
MPINYYYYALAEKQGAFLLTARPIIAALTVLDHPSEEEEGPDPDLVKGILEDALVLLGNANVRLNTWRQRRFSEYLTEVGKRTLKEEIPSDQHLFPDRFHDRIKDEHNYTATNKNLISKPHDKDLSSPRFIPSRQPFNFVVAQEPLAGVMAVENEGGTIPPEITIREPHKDSNPELGQQQAKADYPKLEDNLSGSLDPTNGTGLQNTSDRFSTPMEIERDQSSITTAVPHGQCSSGVAQQSSNQAGPTSSGSVCVNFISSGEREQFWPVSSRHKPSCPEPICGTPAI